MSTVQIVGRQYYLADILGDKFRFYIPRYQRPYAWTVEEASEIINDLWAAYTADDEEVKGKDPYFLGSIVLIKKEDVPRAEVIDGQQRLTTVTILLSALRHLLPTKADSISSYLRQKGKELEDIPDEFRLTLRDQDKDFFEKHIQEAEGFSKLTMVQAGDLRNDAQRNIQANALCMRDFLKTKDTSLLEGFTKFIVSKCILVTVSTPDMDSAYRIFSVMNDRGLDLSHADILKAEIVGNITDKSKQDVYAKQWEAQEEALGRDAFIELFGHISMIHVKEKLRTTILKAIRDVVKPSDTPIEFIEKELVPYARALDVVKDADYTSASGAERVNTALGWLNRLDNMDWRPPAMVAVARRGHDPEWLGDFCERLERLAAGMLVMRTGVNERLARYAKVLEALEDNDELALTLSLDLTEREKRLVYQGLDGNLYEMSKVRLYVLLRLDALLSDGSAKYDNAVLTVEHVLPQTPKKGSLWNEWFPDEVEREGWVHRLANLVLLSRKKNSEAQNFDFDTKKDKYFKSDKGVCPFVLTTQVLNVSEWTPSLLDKRQQELMDKLKGLWTLKEWDADSERNDENPPDENAIKADESKKKTPERYDVRERFWSRLLETLLKRTNLFANVSPRQYGWIGAGAGKRGLGFNYAVREHEIQVELYIDRGNGSKQENKAIFDRLVALKNEIETAFGEELDWQRLDEGRACRIRKVLRVGGYRDAEKWQDIHEAASDAMARFEKALKPAIAKLSV